MSDSKNSIYKSDSGNLAFFKSGGFENKLCSKSTLMFSYSQVWRRVYLKIHFCMIVMKIINELRAYGKTRVSEYVQGFNKNLLAPYIKQDSSSSQIGLSSPEVEIRRFVLLPSSWFANFWAFIVFLMLIYTATVMPFVVVFLECTTYDTWWWVDWIQNFLFSVDILVNFCMAYYDDGYVLVTDIRKIALRYLKTWFIIDLIACMPFDWMIYGRIDTDSSLDKYGNFVRFLRLPRIYNLIRLSRIQKALKHVQLLELFESVSDFFKLRHTELKLLKACSIVILAIHIIACSWYYTAKLDGFSPDTWVVRSGYIDKSVGEKYLTSVYWALTTLSTVGYGDISASTVPEIFITIIWMIFGIWFFSFVVGSLSSMLSSEITKYNIFRGNTLNAKYAIIDSFAKEANFSRELKRKLRQAVIYSTEKIGFSLQSKMDLYEDLPRQLKYECALAMHNGAAKELVFFQKNDSSLTSALVPYLKPLFVPKSEFVYKEKEHADEIYFIISGKISFVYDNPTEIYKTIYKGNHFGEIEVLDNTARRYRTMAIKSTELLFLKKNYIDIIRNEFKNVYHELVRTAEVKDKTLAENKARHKMMLRLRQAGELKNFKYAGIHCRVKESCIKKPLKMSGSEPLNITANESNANELLLNLLQRLDSLEVRVKKTSKLIKRFSKY